MPEQRQRPDDSLDARGSGGECETVVTVECEGDKGAPREDRFYQGVIIKLFSGRRVGVIRTGNGREIPFSFSTVELIGAANDFDGLYEGMPVGFDLTRTCDGLRATRIKVYGRS